MTEPTYEGCAFGPCKQSLERGGPGCRMCDVVAKGRVCWRTAGVCSNSKKRHGAGCPSCDKKGRHLIVMSNESRDIAREAVKRSEQQLTKTQAKKVKAAAGKK